MTQLSKLFSDIPWAVWEFDAVQEKMNTVAVFIAVLEPQVTLDFKVVVGLFSISMIHNKLSFG